MTIRTTSFRTEYSAPNTDKGAVLHQGYMCFGRWDGVKFIVAHFPHARSYKTTKGAERAAAKWIAA